MLRWPVPRNPVILIHGIDDTAALFSRLKVSLEDQGWAVHSFDLVPSDGAVGLDKLAGQVATYVSESLPADGSIDLIGFSMGGLVARYYVQRLAGARRVERLVTISTPHRGTWTAFGRANLGARQMRPHSEFLRELNRDRQALSKVRFTSIWSPLDLMIVPATSSLLPEARSIRVNVLAHALMLRDRRVLRLVAQALSTL